MRREDYVSFEVAKMLKENMYHWPCDSLYTLEGILKYRTIPDDFNRLTAYSRPCLYDAKKWLRTKYNIHVMIGNNASGYYWALNKADNGTFICDYNDSGPNDGGCWDTYEEALNAGILETLKLICL